MKYIGIDYGKKRIGVALSDDAGLMGFPYVTIENTPTAIDEIGMLITQHQVNEIVMGQSKNLDGSDNPIQSAIDVFAKELKDRYGVVVHFEPEFFSTREAAAATTEKGEKDAAAASVILNSFLLRNKEVIEEVEQFISYDDFAKIEIRIGTILEVNIVENADKLLKLQVDFGDETRQIVSGIREFFADPQALIGTQCPFVTNLSPRTIRGEVSNGMILAARDVSGLAVLHPSIVVDAGTKVS